MKLSGTWHQRHQFFSPCLQQQPQVRDVDLGKSNLVRGSGWGMVFGPNAFVDWEFEGERASMLVESGSSSLAKLGWPLLGTSLQARLQVTCSTETQGGGATCPAAL